MSSRNFRNQWVLPLLLLLVGLLLGSLAWGTAQYRERRHVTNELEAHYARSSANLTVHVKQLHDQLSKLALYEDDSVATSRNELLQIWATSEQAHHEVTQLPLSYLPFDAAEQLLTKINRYVFALAADGMDEKAVKTLEKLRHNVGELSTSLDALQSEVMTSGLRWTSVTSKLTDGYRSWNDQVADGEPRTWNDEVDGAYASRTTANLGGNRLDEQQAKQRAIALVPELASMKLTVQLSGEGTPLETIQVQSVDGAIALDFTVPGGKLLAISRAMSGMPANRANTNAATAENRAIGYARKLFGNEVRWAVVADSRQVGNGVWDVALAPMMNGTQAAVLPRTIQMRIGERQLIRVQAYNYQLEPVKLPARSERVHLPVRGPDFVREVIIRTKRGQWVWAYQYRRSIDDRQAIVTVNARDNSTVNVEFGE